MTRTISMLLLATSLAGCATAGAFNPQEDTDRYATECRTAYERGGDEARARCWHDAYAGRPRDTEDEPSPMPMPRPRPHHFDGYGLDQDDFDASGTNLDRQITPEMQERQRYPTNGYKYGVDDSGRVRNHPHLDPNHDYKSGAVIPQDTAQPR